MVKLYVYIGVFEVARQRAIVSFDGRAFVYPLETPIDELETATYPVTHQS